MDNTISSSKSNNADEELINLRKRVKELDELIRKQREIVKTLEKSEELYRQLVEISPDAITATDLSGTIIMVNQQSLKIYGCREKSELIGTNAFDYIAPQDKEKALLNSNKIKETGSIKNIEYLLIKKDGTQFCAELSASCIQDSDGNPAAFIAVVRDISKRKEAENALRKKEELYRTLIETSPDSITVIDQDGTLLLANPVTRMVFGDETDDPILGKNILDFITPEEREQAKLVIKEIIRTGQQMVGEYTVLQEHGGTFPIEASVTLITGHEGGAKELIVMARDISERKKIEKDLAEEKDRLTVTLQSIAEGVITVDIEGNIVLMNGVAAKLTGCKHKEVIGSPLEKVLFVFHLDRQVSCEERIKKVIHTGNVMDIYSDEVLRGQNGKEYLVNQSLAPIKNKNGRIVGVVFIIRDVTEKQKMEKELFKSKKLESIGILAGGIAHDFNNILTGITSNLFMAKMGLPTENESYGSILEAEKAAFRASRLTNQLLTFSKGGDPIKESQAIDDIIEEAVGFSLSGSNVDCQLSLPDDLWQLEIDRGQIDQVINNLIINADQAMPDGGTIEVRAENVVIDEYVSEGTNAYLPLPPGKYVRISIKDEGVGIPPENLDKIYDPYFTTKENGTGLGLTICHSILRKHHGLIFVKSRVNYGTIFHVYLPASEKKKIEIHSEEKGSHLAGSGKVLVMDDEDVVRIAAGHVLKIIGYDVAFAVDGIEAIEVYKKALSEGRPFDVVIMDLTIPGGIGGKEAIKQLKAIDPNVKAIVSSGYSNDTVMANYREYGFCGVVSKPYLIEDLNRALRQAIES